MKKKAKKQWSNPKIVTSLKIKKTLSRAGTGADGGSGSNRTRS